MIIYLFLFCIGFANEYLLTSYAIEAVKGARMKCVVLTMVHQIVACTGLFNIVDVEPGSREQFFRWFVTALSYGAATYVVVKPKET